MRCAACARPLCPACDHRIRGFPHCQDCIVSGVELLQHQQAKSAVTPLVRRKVSPFASLLLSLIVPGLGAAYNGQTSKALVHFAIFASFFQMATVTDGVLFFVLGMIFSWLFAIVDAYRTAQLIRAGLAPDAEGDAIARRLYGNPFAWAILLIVIGTIFLLHTLFGIQLPVREFLPVALVALGAYMLYDFFANRRKREGSAFDARRPPPSVVGSGPLGALGFSTDELATQISARDSVAPRPFEPRL